MGSIMTDLSVGEVNEEVGEEKGVVVGILPVGEKGVVVGRVVGRGRNDLREMHGH